MSEKYIFVGKLYQRVSLKESKVQNVFLDQEFQSDRYCSKHGTITTNITMKTLMNLSKKENENN